MKYSMSGLFLINGYHIIPEWAPPHNDISEKVGSYHSEPLEEVEDEMVINGARRCLIMKKHVLKKPKSSDLKRYPSPKSNYSELDITEIKKDFSKFGEVLEVTPVISKKLCVAIHYFATESAIKAKNEFGQTGTQLRDKYREWTLWYGKDSADRSVLKV